MDVDIGESFRGIAAGGRLPVARAAIVGALSDVAGRLAPFTFTRDVISSIRR
jgi:hypothetical protein